MRPTALLRPNWARRGIAVVMAMVPLGAVAQSLSFDDQFTYTQWTTQDGLPTNVVRGTAVDSEGFLWIATLSGAARFDGVNFEIFDLSNSPGLASELVTDVARDRWDDGIWLSTPRGNSIYHHGSLTCSGPGAHALRTVGGPQGEIWFSKEEGLWRQRGVETRLIVKRRLSSSGFKRPLYVDGDGDVWFVRDHSLFHVVGGQVLREYALPRINYLCQIWEDSSGRILLNTIEGFYSVQDGVGHHLRLTEMGFHQGALPTGAATEFAGEIWLLVDGKVYRTAGLFESKTGRPIEMTQLEGVNRLDADGERSLWVSTELDGLYRISRRWHQALSELPHWTNPIHTNASQVLAQPWMSSAAPHPSGVAGTRVRSLDGSVFHEFPSIAPIRAAVSSARSGGYWLAHGEGLVRVEGGVFVEEILIDEKLLPPIHNVHEDRSGRLWWTTQDGATHQVSPNHDELILPGFFLFEAKDGSLWSHSKAGLFRSTDSGRRQFSRADGLPRAGLRMAAEDEDGRLWITTRGGGLLCIRGDELSVLTRGHGLPDNTLAGILRHDDELWINGNSGLYVVRIPDLVALIDGGVGEIATRRVDQTESSRGWAAVGRDGRFYFDSFDGVVSFDPELDLPENPISPVRIVSVEGDGESHAAAARIELSRGVRNIEIRYAAPEFTGDSPVQYRYRMTDLSDEWMSARTRRSAFFTRLPPGEHRFEVQAANFDSWWTGEVEAMTIVVPPFFYETAPFRALAVLSAGLLVISAYRIRTRSHRRHLSEVQAESTARLKAEQRLRTMGQQLMNAQEAERQRIARDLHDDVNQRVSLLAVQLQMLNQEQADPEVARIVTSVQELSADIHRITHALNPARLEHLGLATSLRYLCAELSESSSVEVVWEQDQQIEDPSGDTALGLFRIAQEAIHNAVKYSGATHIHVSLHGTELGHELRIHDEGSGFVYDERRGAGLGLTTMVERARSIGGNLRVETEPGGGTEVIARSPRKVERA